MKRIFQNNPYRILGVFANSTMKEIVANKGKMNAFLKVKKAVSFPLDLTNILGDIQRSPETLSSADSKLTLESDKIKSAQFWFFKMSQFDDIALNHLSSGSIDGALSVWQKKENMSSLQNMAICHLLRGDVPRATLCVSKVYEKYRNEFLRAIDVKRDVPMAELVENYVSAITEVDPNIDVSALTGSNYSASWNSLLMEKAVQPILTKLNNMLSACKQSKGKDPKVRLEAGRKLAKESKILLFKLRKMLPANDLQLVNVSDKIGNEILQCGIDYYNASDDLSAAREALELQNAATMIVMGKMAKDRCRENGEILNNNLQSLPPNEVAAEYSQIRSILGDFVALPDTVANAEKLLNSTEELLKIIKKKLGATNEFYLKESSLVVRVCMSKLIGEVNSSQDALNNAYSGGQLSAFNRYKNVLNAAAGITTRLGWLGMDKDTKEYFEKNNETLKELRNQVNSIDTSGGGSNDDGCLSQIFGWLIAGGIIFLIKMCAANL